MNTVQWWLESCVLGCCVAWGVWMFVELPPHRTMEHITLSVLSMVAVPLLRPTIKNCLRARQASIQAWMHRRAMTRRARRRLSAPLLTDEARLLSRFVKTGNRVIGVRFPGIEWSVAMSLAKDGILMPQPATNAYDLTEGMPVAIPDYTLQILRSRPSILEDAMTVDE